MNTPTRQTAFGASSLFFGLAVVAIGCSKGTPEGEKVKASSQAATPIEGELEGAATPPASPEEEADDAWREQTLEELCKDWKGAYYPPKGHTPADKPGKNITNPGIACGYRPIGWDGSRKMFWEQTPEQKQTTQKAWHRAWELLTLKEVGGYLKASEAMPILQEEFEFEHIGLGEVSGMETLHFTVVGGAPVVIWPGTWEIPGGLDSLRERLERPAIKHAPEDPLYLRCGFSVGLYWPPPGHTPMDAPEALTLERGSICGDQRPEPLPREVSAQTRRKEEAVRTRIRELLDVYGQTPIQVSETIREEFGGFAHINAVSPHVGILFRLEGGTTQSMLPAKTRNTE